MSHDAKKDAREVLRAAIKAHAPIRCETDHPERRSHWWTCACRSWASEKTVTECERRHDDAFVEHLTDEVEKALANVIPSGVES